MGKKARQTSTVERAVEMGSATQEDQRYVSPYGVRYKNVVTPDETSPGDVRLTRVIVGTRREIHRWQIRGMVDEGVRNHRDMSEISQDVRAHEIAYTRWSRHIGEIFGRKAATRAA
jgi:hypothetical protein